MTALLKLHAPFVLLVSALLLCLPARSESGGKNKKTDKADKTAEKKFESGQDHLKGRARWEWKLYEGNKKVDDGTFMGYVDGRICHGKDQVLVGNWKFADAKDAVSVTFTWPRLKGTFLMQMTRGDPPTYEGTSGKAKKKLFVEIFND